MKITISGNTAIAEPAIRAPHSVSVGMWTLRNASGKVNISGERITISGPMKLFQDAIKAISPNVPNAGPKRGTTTR